MCRVESVCVWALCVYQGLLSYADYSMGFLQLAKIGSECDTWEDWRKARWSSKINNFLFFSLDICKFSANWAISASHPAFFIQRGLLTSNDLNMAVNSGGKIKCAWLKIINLSKFDHSVSPHTQWQWIEWQHHLALHNRSCIWTCTFKQTVVLTTYP